MRTPIVIVLCAGVSTGIARADRWTERCKSRLAPIAKTLAAADRDAKVRVDAPFEATSPWLEGNVDGVALTVDMQGTRVLTVAIADFDSPRFAHGWEMILTLPADEPDVRRERRYFYTPDRRLTRLDEPDGATLDWFGYAHRRGKRLAWFTATTPLDVALVARIERAVERAADECLQLR